MPDLPRDAAPPQPTNLADYRPPDFAIDRVELDFALGEEETRVAARLSLRRRRAGAPLRLDGESLELLSLKLDGAAAPHHFDGETLVLPEVPDAFTLETEVRIEPQNNTALSGLYKSGGNFCTQCEAEGFRRITYFLDRPDVMARYRVIITAD